MGKQLKNLSLLTLIVANIVPLIGAIFFSWNLTVIMLLFWIENLVIGMYALLKIFIGRGSLPLMGAIFTALFFIIHYGLFWSVHGVFLANLLGIEVVDSVSMLPAPVMLGIDVLQTVWPDYRQELSFGVIALILSHGFSLYDNFLRRGEYKLQTSSLMPTGPYRRVLLLHFTLIVGALIIDYFGQPIFLLVLLVLIKTIMDASLHLKEHRFDTDEEPSFSPALQDNP